MADDDGDVITLTDPKAIRAIAHPARLVVLGALYDEGLELTATQAAARAGTSPSAMSYHLRALERFGIVKRAPGASDARERPWVRAARSFRLHPTAGASPTAAAAATGAVIAAAMDYTRERLLEALLRKTAQEADGEGERPRSLETTAAYENTTLVVTLEEFDTLLEQLHAVLEPFRVETRADPPPDAGRVNVTLAAVPDPEPGTASPEQGG